jgi:dimethylargininase
MEVSLMKKFNHVIVRRPCRAMIDGITSAPELGKPDYEKALRQHDDYISALSRCGVDITILPPDERYPDSCFVEDPALITRECAIITNPGAASRNGEKYEIIDAIRKFFPEDRIEHITDPGTLEGGDVMMVGDHFYVGRSARTNAEGIRQLTEILAKYGMTCSEVPLEKVLHLKTGVNYLENNKMLVAGEFVTKPDFEKYEKFEIPESEAYAANCIWVNDTVIVPEGYPHVLEAVKSMGYTVLTVDTSEYRKLDGGLSCLSLRF